MAYIDWRLLSRPVSRPMERVVSDDILKKLERHFYIDREVTGVHFTGKPVRIDAILRPIDSFEWRDPNCSIGLEIKRGSDRVGEITKQISQAVDYANSSFDGVGMVYVFCYPDPAAGQYGSSRRFYERLVGQMGVGFLSDTPCLRLELKGHLVWSEATGPCEAKNWSLARKFGSK